MKIYLAARYDRLAEMNRHANQLRLHGFEVTSRWLNGSHQIHPGATTDLQSGGFTNEVEGVPLLARPFAEDDIEDICASDAVIFFSEPPDSHSKRGGRHVEFGFALARGKQIMVVGPRENVFHCLQAIKHFPDFDTLLESLP